jgi:membrane protein YdbS with pleckstrin-like domain
MLPARLLTLGLGGAAFAAVVGAAATTISAAAAWVGAGAAALLAVALVPVVVARFRAWGYLERDDDLLVRRGVLVRRLSVVPYGRMQFVDVTAGPVDRLFGLATVHLHTAAAHTDARIPGLSVAEAERLRDRLAALGEARAGGL